LISTFTCPTSPFCESARTRNVTLEPEGMTLAATGDGVVVCRLTIPAWDAVLVEPETTRMKDFVKPDATPDSAIGIDALTPVVVDRFAPAPYAEQMPFVSIPDPNGIGPTHAAFRCSRIVRSDGFTSIRQPPGALRDEFKINWKLVVLAGVATLKRAGFPDVKLATAGETKMLSGRLGLCPG